MDERAIDKIKQVRHVTPLKQAFELGSQLFL
jgi:hypothetical protein